MFSVLECVVYQHDLRFVLIAALVCILGNISLFVVLNRSTHCVDARRRHWLVVAAVAEGVGVWATHFVAMLAYRGSMPIRFDVGLTILSVAVAIAFFWCSFRWLGKAPDALRCGIAAAGASTGVAAMHFIGMASIIAPARVTYDWAPILVSALLSGLCFFAAFFAFARTKGWRKIALPAGFAVLAIVVMHFTAMSATTLVPDPTRGGIAGAASSRDWLVPAIVIANIALVSLALTGSLIDRWLTDAHGLADATLEALAITYDGRIIEVNARLCSLLGVSSGAIIGSTPSDWFIASNGTSFEPPSGHSAEARLRNSSDEDHILEIATQTIEYRGRSCQVLAIRDLSDRKRAQRAIEHLASHDALTNLSNRAHFGRALDAALNAKKPFALLALDLDRFKAVNDIFGHGAGDEILCRIADILRSAVRADDVVARIGGDEFLVIQTGVSGPDDARKLSARILDTLAIEMDVARDPMAVGVSIGVALFPQDGSDAETLQRNADTALYRAKNNGKGNAAFFDQEMDELARERRALEHDLRHAIARNELYIVFQPLVATAFASVVGYEALLRWEHPERGDVPPDYFIPVAEEIGAIVPIGEWVLREACRTAAGWPKNVSVAVNVSTVQFQVPNLPAIVRDALSQSGLEARRLELEITETAFLRNKQSALKALHEIRALGVRIAMDDFGTGYSSLSNLKAFPFDKIKIDKSFVASIPDDEAARSIVRAIIGLGRSFNMPIVAEGVETGEQRQMLLDEGCPQAQGYYFGRPAPDPFLPESLSLDAEIRDAEG
ncbi:diguanylate cyclase/phosphodiesterase [Sphingopyxis sp. YR583]|jgi:diguanylate cyclase (GGDEF)-like protein|uniref:bifunctional diguanylate cyclase/phosphodiesterase n=1 Tax=Sphingopyxis sp. YR583 TaxID=1881047 RepID=UPI0008A79C39|nr:EAL domain-containing protein [Sphingopyxis sp. YR583]SEH20423.1 diguanylate cyclase/phosphodiesterase [Sphingopyxis sp. YR583]